MGYAHYWYLKEGVDLSAPLERITSDFRAMLPHLPRLAGPDGTGQPIITPREMAFNGPRPEDCESFVFPGGLTHSASVPGYSFDFCKTNRQPYDLAVKVALLLAKAHLGHWAYLMSDGPSSDWEKARQLIERVLHLPILLHPPLVDSLPGGGS